MMKVLTKTPSGIEGLDEITNGGLPTGRTTLICGSAGSGKTVFGLEFLIHGVIAYDEPGVFLAFEEAEEDLSKNVASFGYDLEKLKNDHKLVIDHVYIERSEIEETGDYDLEGLFIRLGAAVDSIGAKRVVIDTVEVLFAGLKNHSIIRAELRRLFRWLKDRGLTAIVTGERGDNLLTRYGLEEYVADCVILLDHRVTDQLSTRRLRIVKYRGSVHGSDEYPFLMGQNGISVLPITSVGLNHGATDERVSCGIAAVDRMLGNQGFYRDSSVLITGTAGTGKSSFAAHFVDAACARGEHAIFFSFEESAQQILRNMRSIGIDLKPWIDKGLLEMVTIRPSSLGLEAHLAAIHQKVKQLKPSVVVIDPITTFITLSNLSGVRSMLTRLVDFLKMQQITTVFTHLSNAGTELETTDEGVSSIMDCWILLRDIEQSGVRSYAMYILKCRGVGHSHELRPYAITSKGFQLSGPKQNKENGTGKRAASSRDSQEASSGGN